MLTSSKTLRCARGGLLACGLLLLGANSAHTASIPAECATRDLQTLTHIEEHGQRQDVTSDRLAMAVSAMLVARSACLQGRTDAALAIYELIYPEVILIPLKH